jgi:hypothetical protein|tara:strand:+ start:139 stop:1398 length:1260 start_codon:yes stop_codon:yes gene_type:complete
MGCFGSRFDKRKGTCTDLNTVGIQYVGGEGSNNDFCPQDAVSLFYGDSKEVDEWFKVGPLTMESEEEGKKIALEAWSALVQQGNFLKDNFGNSDKTVYVSGKYQDKDAIAQIEAVKAFLKEKNPDIEFPEEAKPEAEAMEGEMMEGEMMAEEMMEGGEDGAMEKPDLYAGDSAAYEGFANLPALLLKCCTAQPYFGDLVKSALIHYEFNFKGKSLADVPMPKLSLADLSRNPLNAKETTPGQWAGVAALVAAALDKAEATAADVWFSGYLGAQDVEALKAMAEGDNILFPGWMAGWKSEDEAKTHLTNLGEFNGDDSCDKVIITTNTKCASAVVCHLFSQRFNGKLKSFVQDEESKIWTLTVEDDSWEYSTLADWKTWVEEEAKKKAEAAAAAAMEGAAAEGEMAAAEGEMMAEEMAAE